VNFTFGGDDTMNPSEDQLSYLTTVHDQPAEAWKAILQKPWLKTLDNSFRIDGNAILTRAQNPSSPEKNTFSVLRHDIVHLSESRAAQRLLLRLDANGRYISFVNVHLHHVSEEPEIRESQVRHLCSWLNEQEKIDSQLLLCGTCSSTFCHRLPDYTIVTGDFNAPPTEPAYQVMKSQGFRSAYHDVHAREPEKTFPTGLQADTMDTDPKGTFDYIWIRTSSCSPTPQGFKVLSAVIGGNIPLPHDPTIYPSDHYSITVELQL